MSKRAPPERAAASKAARVSKPWCDDFIGKAIENFSCKYTHIQSQNCCEIRNVHISSNSKCSIRIYTDRVLFHIVSNPRTFDIAAGDHPVKWVLETLSFGEGIVNALWQWLDEVAPGVVPAPCKLTDSDPLLSPIPWCAVTLS